jgi:hypothetical protein
MTFRVGQKVVCIAKPIARLKDLGLPGFIKGLVYTITSFYEEVPHGTFLTAAELDQRVGGQCCGFRPVVDHKTEISFTHGADPSSDQFDNRRVAVGAPV